MRVDADFNRLRRGVLSHQGDVPALPSHVAVVHGVLSEYTYVQFKHRDGTLLRYWYNAYRFLALMLEPARVAHPVLLLVAGPTSVRCCEVAHPEVDIEMKFVAYIVSIEIQIEKGNLIVADLVNPDVVESCQWSTLDTTRDSFMSTSIQPYSMVPTSGRQ